MSPIHAYLTFDGNAAEAMRFYEKTLGGTMQMMMTIGEAPDTGQMPDDVKKRIMHASLAYGDGMLMASDTMPGMTFVQGNNVWININCESDEEIERFFKALGEGGTVMMPLADQFWGAKFGMLKDRYSIHWMFNFEKPR